jgi:pyruvate/2-oxoglutarate/acetoin dehydrogenase E1 component
MVVEVLRAAELLHEVGIEAEVVDPIWLQPLDCETIIRSVERTRRLLVVDNAWVNCGASAEIAARVADELFDKLDAPVRRVAALDTWVGYHPQLENEILPQTEDLEREMERLLSY